MNVFPKVPVLSKSLVRDTVLWLVIVGMENETVNKIVVSLNTLLFPWGKHPVSGENKGLLLVVIVETMTTREEKSWYGRRSPEDSEDSLRQCLI